MIKVKELRGYKSLRALNAFQSLVLGLKMLPKYMGVSYEDFYDGVSKMDSAAQERLLREAVMFVELSKEEVEALVGFACDANGVSYSAENLGNLDPKQIHEIIVAVCMEMAKFKIDMVSEAEKKK